MKYTVSNYVKGVVASKLELEAPNPKRAFVYAKIKDGVSHTVVSGSNTVVFDRNGEQITDEPRAFSLYYQFKFHVILVMIGTKSELYHFKDKEHRDEVFKCITSMSAESATTEGEQTSTTVSLDETKDTKSGSMSPKILSGSAMNATWRDTLTRESIARPSGTPKLEDTAENIWSSGSKAYPSKHGQILATVKIPRADKHSWEWPGMNRTMYRMNGKTLNFKPSAGKKPAYSAKGFIWKPGWMDFRNVVAKVKELPDGTEATTANCTEITYSNRYAGKILKLQLCTCGCGCYHKGGYYYHPDWLEAKGYTEKDVNE